VLEQQRQVLAAPLPRLDRSIECRARRGSDLIRLLFLNGTAMPRRTRAAQDGNSDVQGCNLGGSRLHSYATRTNKEPEGVEPEDWVATSSPPEPEEIFGQVGEGDDWPSPPATSDNPFLREHHSVPYEPSFHSHSPSLDGDVRLATPEEEAEIERLLAVDLAEAKD
jgi:hypothetical protein